MCESWCRSEAKHKSVVFEGGAEENIRCMTSVLSHKVYSLSASPNIIGVIKSKRPRWMGHVVRTREKRK